MKPIARERTTRASEDRWRREIIAMRNGVDPISQLQSGGPQCIILERLAIAPPRDDFRCNPITVGAARSIRNEDISSASRQNLASQLAQPARSADDQCLGPGKRASFDGSRDFRHAGLAGRWMPHGCDECAGYTPSGDRHSDVSKPQVNICHAKSERFPSVAVIDQINIDSVEY